MDKEKIKKAVVMILEAIGEDPTRDGLKRTPERVAEMYTEIFSGLKKNPEDFLETTHKLKHDEMVLVKGIPIYSMCEHHLLPFFGKAHVAYIPQGERIIGFSKLARVVDLLAKQPQVQENLTTQFADILMKKLKPQGVGVVIEARHLCMEMRGIKKIGTNTITSAVRGNFRSDKKTRAEFFSLIKDGFSS